MKRPFLSLSERTRALARGDPLLIGLLLVRQRPEQLRLVLLPQVAVERDLVQLLAGRDVAHLRPRRAQLRPREALRVAKL